MSQEIDILKRALQREKQARKSAEKILEAKSLELFHASKKLGNLLEEKSNQLQGVFENIIDAYIIIDLQGNILKFNDAASKLFGYDIDNEELNVLQLVYKDDFDYAIESFTQLSDVGVFKNFESRIRTKSNEVKWVRVNASLIYDSGKVPIAAQGIARDITNIKNLEVQQGELLSRLEKSNMKLQEYAHIVSHDLKSPLRNIDALINWIKEDNKGKLDESSLKNFGLIEGTLEKMEKLITDVLEYSSLEAREEVVTEVDSYKLVKEVINMLFIPEHINVKACKDLPIIKGYPTKLRQLFQNLINNAIKFNDKENGFIEIDAKDAGVEIQFSISDNGMGIEEKFHSQIFEIFRSLQNRKDSNGIGLSVVKKIVELHQGRIWVKSKLNEGASFYFTLVKNLK